MSMQKEQNSLNDRIEFPNSAYSALSDEAKALCELNLYKV